MAHNQLAVGSNPTGPTWGYPMSKGKDTCDRYGDEYDSYVVLVRDTVSDMVAYANNDFDNLCKPCRMSVADYGVYLTEEEREELEPKHKVE